jgi:hypothetical protein
MDRARANDLHAFKDFIDDQLGGATVPTDDKVIARWDSENETAEDTGATVEALREALADIDAGETGIPVHEALLELRRKHQLLLSSCKMPQYRLGSLDLSGSC